MRKFVYSGDDLISGRTKSFAEGDSKMYPVNLEERTKVADRSNPYLEIPLTVEFQPDRELDQLLADLSSDTPWGERQNAAKKLGCKRSSEALPVLLDTLPADPFWMVRCAIIQALEMIGDPAAIPTLCEVAKKDGFQVVRSYAAKAVISLSQQD